MKIKVFKGFKGSPRGPAHVAKNANYLLITSLRYT